MISIGQEYKERYEDAERKLAALREELATMTADRNAEKDMKATARMQRDKVTKRLADAELRNAELQKDKDRLDALEQNFWDVRHGSHPIADTGDSSISLEIVGHWMDKPFERVIGENYSEDLRAAIDQAMASPAYPPERPEYPEIDAALTPNPEAASHDE
jgi:hypothetical protein